MGVGEGPVGAAVAACIASGVVGLDVGSSAGVASDVGVAVIAADGPSMDVGVGPASLEQAAAIARARTARETPVPLSSNPRTSSTPRKPYASRPHCGKYMCWLVGKKPTTARAVSASVTRSPCDAGVEPSNGHPCLRVQPSAGGRVSLCHMTMRNATVGKIDGVRANHGR